MVADEYSDLSKQQNVDRISEEDKYMLGEEMEKKELERQELTQKAQELEIRFKEKFNPDPILTTKQKTEKEKKEKKLETRNVLRNNVDMYITEKAEEIEKLNKEKDLITSGLIRSDAEHAYGHNLGAAYSQVADVNVDELDAKIAEVNEKMNIIYKQIEDSKTLLKATEQEISTLSTEISEFTKPKTDLSDLPKTLQESLALREEMLKKPEHQPSTRQF